MINRPIRLIWTVRSLSLRKMMKLAEKYFSKNIVARVPIESDLHTMEEFGGCGLESIHTDGDLEFQVAYSSPGRPMAETAAYLRPLE